MMLFFGDMEDIRLFTIIITMCPGVPDTAAGYGSVAKMSLFELAFYVSNGPYGKGFFSKKKKK